MSLEPWLVVCLAEGVLVLDAQLAVLSGLMLLNLSLIVFSLFCRVKQGEPTRHLFLVLS